MANNNTVKKKKVKMSTGDKVFAVINTIIMILVCIAIVYPLYYVLLASVTDPVNSFSIRKHGTPTDMQPH